MKEYSLVPDAGYMPIFPNNKHGNAFGYPCGDFSGLSPMRLGPVRHGQASLPDAMNIENYHQCNKVFPNEILPNTPCDCPRSARWAHMKAAPIFYSKRLQAYLDVVPHRHKYDDAKLKAANKAYVKGNKNVPLYSVHEIGNEERHFTYVESRYFYCIQMETLIGSTRQAEWQRLQDYLARGYALQIVGYDAFRPTATDSDALYAHYQDGSRPFGHEMVILTILCLPNAADRPWHRYNADHPGLYE